MVYKDVVCQHFTLTPALSLKGEGELKDPDQSMGVLAKLETYDVILSDSEESHR